jgi:hypothetical protein
MAGLAEAPSVARIVGVQTWPEQLASGLGISDPNEAYSPHLTHMGSCLKHIRPDPRHGFQCKGMR